MSFRVPSKSKVANVVGRLKRAEKRVSNLKALG